MNICFVVLSIGWAGAETVIYELARHLRDREINVSIILNEEIFQYYADLNNIELLNVGSLYPPKSTIFHPGNSGTHPKSTSGGKRSHLNRLLLLPSAYIDELLRYLYFKKLHKRIMRFLLDNNINIISPICEDAVPLVSEMANDLKAANIFTIAMVAGEYNLMGAEPVNIMTRLILKWKANRFKKGLGKADKVIGPSAFVLHAWQHQGVLLEHKYVVVRNGVNPLEIRECSLTDMKLKGDFNLLFPGGAKLIKGGDLVIECLPEVKREIPNVHLYIAWDVPLKHDLRKMVQAKGIEDNVTFVGLLPKQDYRHLLNAVDLLVMPSRQEAFGIVYVEAMASGKPIVASNTGGIHEVVKDGKNGILVDLDHNQIAEAILNLYRNKDLREKISHNNLQDVSWFDWRQVADRYIEIYKEVLGII